MVNPHAPDNYWEGRGASGFYYRGERLYTITAAPYYLARRAVVDEEIVRELQKRNAGRILDFGCGDGSCIERLRPRHAAGASWTGFDVSSTMLQQARNRCPGVLFVSSAKELTDARRFDFVCAVTVLAHIPDGDLPVVLAELGGVLEPDAGGLLFEQIAPSRHDGRQFVRRSISDYCGILGASGFTVDDVKVLDWPVHRLFERSIAKIFYRYLCGRGVEHERRIAANRSRLFRGLSRLCLFLSRGGVSEYSGPCWGYGMFRFRKATA